MKNRRVGIGYLILVQLIFGKLILFLSILKLLFNKSSEPNYVNSFYIAELYNSFSSLIISMFGIMGLLWGNPTKEWRFTIMYLILVVIGLGSFWLHSTLQAIPQSSDEVPMLWQTLSILFSLMEMKSKRETYSIPFLPYIFILILVIQTYIYYTYQHLYVVFLFVFISSAALIILLSGNTLFDTTLPSHIRIEYQRLWIASFVAFVIIGAGFWIYEMNFCVQLLPYYHLMNGLTFHVIWHTSAGYASYAIIMQHSLLRMYYLKDDNSKISFDWAYGILPIWRRKISLE